MVIKIQYVLHSPKGWTVGRFGRKIYLLNKVLVVDGLK